jgi:hypothetical protein
VLKRKPVLLPVGIAALVAACVGGLCDRPAAAAGDRQEELRDKPAWQWTIDERITERFRNDRIAERSALTRAARKNHLPAGGAVAMDTLYGRSHAELFLPSEIFRSLLTRTFLISATNRMENRLSIESRAAALGFGQDLWKRLHAVAREALEMEARQLRRPSVQGSEVRGADTCFARYVALEKAKAEFGEERFMRFLFEAVAPDIFSSYTLTTSTADELLYQEGGCL